MNSDALIGKPIMQISVNLILMVKTMENPLKSLKKSFQTKDVDQIKI